MPLNQATIDECGERAPEVRGWIKDVVDAGIGGGWVREGPVKEEV